MASCVLSVPVWRAKKKRDKKLKKRKTSTTGVENVRANKSQKALKEGSGRVGEGLGEVVVFPASLSVGVFRLVLLLSASGWDEHRFCFYFSPRLQPSQTWYHQIGEPHHLGDASSSSLLLWRLADCFISDAYS